MGWLLAALGCGSPGAGVADRDTRHAFEHPAMGTLFRVTLYASDGALARAAAELAFARIDAIEEVATDYDAGSEARCLTGRAVGQWVAVSADLALVLRASERAVRVSGGAFDPTVGALTRHWRRALRNGEWPANERWADASERCGWAALVELRETEEGLGIRLGADGMRLDFGGIAKGVAVDEALVALAAMGIRSALIDGGGDLAALDGPPGSEGWKVRVAPGGDTAERDFYFLLARAAVATSGDRFQRAHLQGTPLVGLGGSLDGGPTGDLDVATLHYGHVLDARSRLPLPVPRAALMTASSAAEADALATARLVLGAEITDSLPLERGVFFGPEGKACVGRAFPHDGVTPLERASAFER